MVSLIYVRNTSWEKGQASSHNMYCIFPPKLRSASRSAREDMVNDHPLSRGATNNALEAMLWKQLNNGSCNPTFGNEIIKCNTPSHNRVLVHVLMTWHRPPCSNIITIMWFYFNRKYQWKANKLLSKLIWNTVIQFQVKRAECSLEIEKRCRFQVISLIFDLK